MPISRWAKKNSKGRRRPAATKSAPSTRAGPTTYWHRLWRRLSPPRPSPLPRRSRPSPAAGPWPARTVWESIAAPSTKRGNWLPAIPLVLTWLMRCTILAGRTINCASTPRALRFSRIWSGASPRGIALVGRCFKLANATLSWSALPKPFPATNGWLTRSASTACPSARSCACSATNSPA